MGTSSENLAMRGVLERAFGLRGVETPMPASRAAGRPNAIEVEYKVTKREWEAEGGVRDRVRAWLDAKAVSVA